MLISGTYEARWGREDEFQLRINDVTMLENAGSKLASSITVKIPVEQISQEMLENLQQLVNEHKGPHDLNVALLDFTNRNSLEFVSKSLKVNVNNDFVQALEKMGLKCNIA